MRREKVAIVLGDAPLLISKLFLQRMGKVLDLEKRQVTFNKLGVTRCNEFEGHLLCFTQEEEKLPSEILSQRVEMGRKRVGPNESLCNKKRSSRSETENVPGGGRF